MEKQTDQHRELQKKGHLRSKEKVILVIDDNPDLLELNQVILEMDGYKVFAAVGGNEAFRILGEIDPPDLILLDMRMAPMSGTDFLTLLEKKRPEVVENVPVVFLSGVDEIPESKAVGFISKPIDNDQFLVSIRRFIDEGSKKYRQQH